jgi:transcriptional regulator with XRE-family HTH domain
MNVSMDDPLDISYTIVYISAMLTELGDELKRARDAMDTSLQTVAMSANISTAYLQKIERGLVDTPSPHVLRRLAASLRVDYLNLMQLAMYLDYDEAALVRARMPAKHPLANAKLTPEQWLAVGKFISGLTRERQ